MLLVTEALKLCGLGICECSKLEWEPGKYPIMKKFVFRISTLSEDTLTRLQIDTIADNINPFMPIVIRKPK